MVVSHWDEGGGVLLGDDMDAAIDADGAGICDGEEGEQLPPLSTVAGLIATAIGERPGEPVDRLASAADAVERFVAAGG
jgi:hypothetical protein